MQGNKKRVEVERFEKLKIENVIWDERNCVWNLTVIADVSFSDVLTSLSLSVKGIIDGDEEENVGLNPQEKYVGWGSLMWSAEERWEQVE